MILRQAKFSDIGTIWEILQQAIEQRRLDGSEQWQQGYPNLNTVHEDIANDYGYVLTDNNVIIAYAAVIFGIEPAYNEIDGSWLTNQDYMAVHRVATSNSAKGKGVATKLFSLLEDLCIQRNVFSIKVDTNFDNAPMLRILEKLSYTYCGEIIFLAELREKHLKKYCIK